MIQELLGCEDNEPKTGKLPIALYENGMRGAEGFFARVINRGTLRIDDIFNDLRSGDDGFDAAYMKKNWDAVMNAIALRISSGMSVDFGLGVLSPAVSGSFDNEQSGFRRGRNRLTVRYRPSEGMKKTMESLGTVIRQGNTCHPEVLRVRDIGSGWDSRDCAGGNGPGPQRWRGLLSCGNILSIEGRRLRIEGGSDDVGLYFDNVTNPGESVKLTPGKLFRNRPSGIECLVPGELDRGSEYRIRVVTQYVNGQHIRNSPLSSTFPAVFAVSG
ncbi:MAG: DUF4469 domain-containing protein [Treponema sp.]|nr:DUF4469 domain-containing protein [Treponema sp.]